MSENKLPVPTQLRHSFLLPDNIMAWEDSIVRNLSFKVPFFYDAAFFSGMEILRPWEHGEESISALLVEWSAVKDEIKVLFSKREREAALPCMRKGIALFLEFLHWGNETPVKLQPKIEYDNLLIKPVNLEERLEFILARPNLYHSSMVLSELMDELEKGYKKAIVIRKRK